MSINALPPKTADTSKKQEHRELLSQADSFVDRHVGPREDECQEMLDFLGLPTLDSLVDEALPTGIRLKRPLQIDEGRSENAVLAELKRIASQNKVFRSYIGMGYH